MSTLEVVDYDADPIEYAYAYANRGWRVLPIKPGEKRPPMGAWQNAATTDPVTIKDWWTHLYKGHGVGVATGRASGIFVLDVDVSDDKAGDETLAELEDTYGALPDTPTVETPSGGVHYYFRLPEGVEIRNDAGKRLGPGLDIRGEGGQVVAPPTARSVDAYEWVGETWLLEPADAPRWLIDRVKELPRVEAAQTPSERPQGVANDDDGPAARYNERTTWTELLEADGWTLADVEPDGEQRWTRPGKETRDGISATVGHGGGDQLTVFSTGIDWLPPGSYSRFGYHACRSHGGDRSEAARALREDDYRDAEAVLAAVPVTPVQQPVRDVQDVQEAEPSSFENRIALAHIVDWTKFWAEDHSDEDWLAYPLLPRGRAVALYAPAKAGKSTVVLAAAAALATGRPIFGARRSAPERVLYLDYEMTQADMQERLMELGYSEDDDLENLCYALLPSLPPLDSVEGAMALLELADHLNVVCVVIDTFGRAVAGEEDHADTVRAFYRHTGLALKAKGITYLRTDHSGKDVSKGMRGSSAKNDDVDLVWKLTRADISAEEHGVRIDRTHSRISWVPESLTIKRVETEAGFDYLLDQSARKYPDGTAHDLTLLIKAGLTSNSSQNKAVAMKPAEMTRRRAVNAFKMFKDQDPTKYLGESR